LPDYNFGVRVDMKRFGLESQSTMQGFKQRNILGDIVILAADPSGDSDPAALGTVDHHPNAGRPRIPQRAAIHIGYEI